MRPTIIDFKNNFTACRTLINPSAWNRITSACADSEKPDFFLDRIQDYAQQADAPDYLAELARAEWHIGAVKARDLAMPVSLDSAIINPSLVLLDLQWTGLANLLNSLNPDTPMPAQELVLIWKNPDTGTVITEAASAEDLLMLKMIVEDIDITEMARLAGLPPDAIRAAVVRATEKAIIFTPSSRIRRDRPIAEISPYTDKSFQVSPSFTLQLHITQECDLHCRHCYDRSHREALTLTQAARILDDLDRFCQERKVLGQISFTGGNPLLHPDFPAMYRAATDHGFTLSVLGNPSNREALETLQAIQPLNFFQVSLEGLPAYNDYIRGKNHFDKTMTFLELLREMNIYSMVMLTLNKDNMDQVIPLGRHLQDKTDAFFFNRLTLVGEGAALALPPREDYMTFLEQYLAATKELPVLGLKDNLLNITMQQQGMKPFGGCTGFGCGAAFNFLAVLPDGEVHACRKFPSLIGNLTTQTIADIYDSEAAGRYRKGSSECSSCPLHLVCGGCLGSAYSHGLDIFTQKDPYCFYETPKAVL